MSPSETRCKLSAVNSHTETCETADPSRPTAAPPLSSETKGHTYLPQDSTISTTDTSSSLQMTRTSSPSASETAEPTLTDYIRAGNVDALTQWTTTSTTEPPNNVHPLVLQSTTSRLVIGCASLVIVCALMGISFFCYRRRSNETPPQAADEQIPMNPAACEELS
ncbi:interleukin-15 receptor subunit alpha isoform X3 [Cottoperca gobio]|uniref:Interleukin-15 receptor subunit alpha isoform X3 n=1 Tax=Cottoperca gobio TaxID=56716 RepID=A0A6J2S8N4_COTGO|nr:agglutinin-like protein ARB_02240 isoform X3 [Cottoperca gobio]